MSLCHVKEKQTFSREAPLQAPSPLSHHLTESSLSPYRNSGLLKDTKHGKNLTPTR